MEESDQAATAFITPYGPFCFNTMPFGLKNASATYQRMIQTCLEKQIGKTVEAYVDDVVIKTRHVCLHYFADLFFQACLNHALIGCTGIFEPERHGVETEWAVWGDECRRSLIRL